VGGHLAQLADLKCKWQGYHNLKALNLNLESEQAVFGLSGRQWPGIQLPRKHGLPGMKVNISSMQVFCHRYLPIFKATCMIDHIIYMCHPTFQRPYHC